MFVHVLIFVCACAALSMAGEGPPPYIKSLLAIKEARATLDKNLLSMDGKIPLLDDPKRQFAEIINVVNVAAEVQSGCLHGLYLEEYQKYLNTSSPQALSKPQLVIDDVKNLIAKIRLQSSELTELVKNCVGPDCDSIIDELVKNNPEKYADQSKVLLLSGEAAAELNANKKLFEKKSKELNAHQFVIKGAKKLEKYVLKVTELYRKLKNYRQC